MVFARYFSSVRTYSVLEIRSGWFKYRDLYFLVNESILVDSFSFSYFSCRLNSSLLDSQYLLQLRMREFISDMTRWISSKFVTSSGRSKFSLWIILSNSNIKLNLSENSYNCSLVRYLMLFSYEIYYLRFFVGVFITSKFYTNSFLSSSVSRQKTSHTLSLRFLYIYWGISVISSNKFDV